MNEASDSVITERVARLSSSTPSRAGAENADGKPLRSLHLNESPTPPSPSVIAAMQAAAASLHRYPDHEATDLVAALARLNGVAAERVVIASGSNELLFSSADVSLDPGAEAIAPVPGFPSYAKAAALRGATYVPVPTRPDGVVDVDATLAAVTDRTRLVTVASPQNPTGGAMRADEIAALAQGLPATVLLHFDEAYYEFARHAGGAETLPILARRKGPWIATRSFSKAFGLAGARVGYGFCSDAALAAAYRKIRVTFSVNAIAQAGALAALSDAPALATLLDHTARERDRLTASLERLGLDVFPSAANFVAFLSPISATDLAARLKSENILVVTFPWRDTPGAVRITIGSREDTDAVVEAIGAILQRP